MNYLYFLTPDRRLINVTDKHGIHECFANLELAKNHSRFISLHAKQNYPVVVRSESDLHNTRDGKPVID